MKHDRRAVFRRLIARSGIAVVIALIASLGVSAPAQAAPVATTTTAYIPTNKVAFGQSITVTGALRTGTTGVAGQRLYLQARPAGQSTWYDKGSAISDSTGRVSVDAGARSTNVAFRFVFKGDSARRASTSEPVYLATTQTLALSGVPNMPEIGTDWVFTGSATFGLVGKPVSLQSKVGDIWATVATVNVSAKATWKAVIKPSVMGTKTFRLVFAGDDTVPPTVSESKVVVAHKWFYLPQIDPSTASSYWYEVYDYGRLGGKAFRWVQSADGGSDWNVTYNLAGKCTMLAAEVGLRDVAPSTAVQQYEITLDGVSRKWGDLGVGPTQYITQSVREAFRVTLSGTGKYVGFGGARMYCSEAPY